VHWKALRALGLGLRVEGALLVQVLVQVLLALLLAGWGQACHLPPLLLPCLHQQVAAASAPVNTLENQTRNADKSRASCKPFLSKRYLPPEP
jgi:hypothetical protein